MRATTIDKIQWYRTPVAKADMDELLERSDSKGLWQAGGHVALAVCTGALTWWAWYGGAWFIALPLFFIHCNVVGTMHAGVHELIHERVFATPWLNRFFVNLLGFLTWWNHAFFNFSHKEHHRYTCNDPLDQEVVLPLGFSLYDAIRNSFTVNWAGMGNAASTNFQFAIGRCPGMFSGGKGWAQRVMNRLTDQERRSIQMCSVQNIVGHGTILLFAVAADAWLLPLLITFAPFCFQLVSTLTGLPQHFGLVRKVQDFRLNCRTYRCNRLFMFLYWNMNYHTEHHMYAAVPCYNLPRLHELIKPDMPVVHQTIWETWLEMLYIQNRQKHDPSFDYVQPFPVDSHNYAKVQRLAPNPTGLGCRPPWLRLNWPEKFRPAIKLPRTPNRLPWLQERQTKLQARRASTK